MDQEMYDLYQDRIKELLAVIPTLTQGSDERAKAVEELEKLQKLVSAHDKIQLGVYAADKRAEPEKIRGRWVGIAAGLGVVSTLISVIGALIGLKSNQDFTKDCEDLGVYPDKNIHKTDPKMRWF